MPTILNLFPFQMCSLHLKTKSNLCFYMMTLILDRIMKYSENFIVPSLCAN